jgi:hypothetical protein
MTERIVAALINVLVWGIAAWILAYLILIVWTAQAEPPTCHTGSSHATADGLVGKNGPVAVPLTKTSDNVWSVPPGAKFTDPVGADVANRVLSAMRKQFGGHDEKKKGRS